MRCVSYKSWQSVRIIAIDHFSYLYFDLNFCANFFLKLHCQVLIITFVGFLAFWTDAKNIGGSFTLNLRMNFHENILQTITEPAPVLYGHYRYSGLK